MNRKFALIIGNSEYEDQSLARLIAPSADVKALGNVLSTIDIGGFDDVSTLVNESATTVRKVIARFFAGRQRDDLLVLYFSGHGVLDERGKLYLAIKDTERILPTGTAIEASFIADVMDGSNSRRQVLILDCCHSGAFARGTKGTPGSSVHTGTAFEGIGTGRVVLTATDATQYAWEGDRVIGQAETSVFTRYLIQGLQTGEADADVDGKITLDELYDYVYTHVVTETPKQTPSKWSYRQQGDIIIARNPRPLVKPVALSQEISPRERVVTPSGTVRGSQVVRLEVAVLLGDDRLHWLADGKEMVRVPAGEFHYGDKMQKLNLPEFWIDKTLVTNAEYARFVAATSQSPPSHWKGTMPPKEIEDHPVVNVSWQDATAYAKWAGKHLPTEQEWEKAARGTDGRVYPWGNGPPDKLCNFNDSVKGTTPVGKYSPQGNSPYGCVDMSGNVWEWTNNDYLKILGKILRGGSWRNGVDYVRVTSRGNNTPAIGSDNVGFRCVVGLGG